MSDLQQASASAARQFSRDQQAANMLSSLQAATHYRESANDQT